MKLTIVSTTINNEKGYLLFDKLAYKSKFDKVSFIISGDLKSPNFDINKFRCKVEYLTPKDQRKYACSEAIGWNKIMRRNIALLRAIELKPDYILMIDDDNIPAKDYFEMWYKVITKSKTRSVISPVKKGEDVWMNYLQTADAPIEIFPRGFPVVYRDVKFKTKSSQKKIETKNIGVFQGISLGDLDIDAMTRIVYPNKINSIKEKNYCMNNVWSPYNTQNTLFSKELFPLAFVWPHCGRYDDIYASFVWQAYMFQNNMFAHIGDAVNFQDRGKRNILKDFNNETEGYLNAHVVCNELKKIKAKTPLKFIEEMIKSENEIIARQRDFLVKWLEDVTAVL